jgi:hypothetical protein
VGYVVVLGAAIGLPVFIILHINDILGWLLTPFILAAIWPLINLLERIFGR